MVFAIVLYNGGAFYPYGTEVSELFGSSSDVVPEFLRASFELGDLNKVSNDDIKAPAWSDLMDLTSMEVDALLNDAG